MERECKREGGRGEGGKEGGAGEEGGRTRTILNLDFVEVQCRQTAAYLIRVNSIQITK